MRTLRARASLERKPSDRVHQANDDKAIQYAASNRCDARRALDAHGTVWKLQLPEEKRNRCRQPEKVRALDALTLADGARKRFGHAETNA